METQKEKDINRKRQKRRKTKRKIKESGKLRMWERYENKKWWERCEKGTYKEEKEMMSEKTEIEKDKSNEGKISIENGRKRWDRKR